MRVKLRHDARRRCSPHHQQRHPGAPARRRRRMVGRGRHRSDPDFLCRCVEAAIKAGATTINIPDTVGYALPEDMARDLPRCCATGCRAIEKVILSTHNHNDLGLAVANTLAAIQAGARQVECTINGIGERAGNAALEEVVMALRTRHDALPIQQRHHPPDSCSRPASCWPPSPASTCSRTRRSSAATPSRMKAASTRTAC